MSTFVELFESLPFQPIDQVSACCEIDGCPVKMTLLGDAPLSLMFGFFVGFHGPRMMPSEMTSLPVASRVDLSLEDGVVWLSLFGLSDPSGGVLAQSVRGIVAELKSAGFVFDATCGLCGAENVTVSIQEGQPVRVCAGCLEAKERRTQELNRFNPSDMLLLPLAALGVIVGWTVVWQLIDLFVEFINGPGNPRLALDELTMMPLIAAGFVLFLLGRQLGGLFRGSGVGQSLVLIAGMSAAVVAVMVGEVCYIATTIFRHHGLFDLFLAGRLLWPWLAGYAASWWVLKICLAACLLFGGFTATREKRVVSLTAIRP